MTTNEELAREIVRLKSLINNLRCAACCKKIVFFTPDSVVGSECYQALQQENKRLEKNLAHVLSQTKPVF